MKAVRNFVDKVKPAFSKNKYLHTAFDAFDTLLFTPNTTTKGGVHIRDGMDLKRTMVYVVLAMQLCLVAGMYNIGHQHYLAAGMYTGLFDGLWLKLTFGLLQFLPMLIVVNVVGLGIEIYFAAKKGHGVEEGFLVTGMLIPLVMPPDVPLWMVAMATAFAVIIAKEAFGGTGMNILNVALTARVFVFFAYPLVISGDQCWIALDNNILHNLFGFQDLALDGYSSATPLGIAAKSGWDGVLAQFSQSELLWGIIPGSIGEMNKPFIVIGALVLVATGIASWRIMLSMVIGLITMGLLLMAVAPNFPENLFLQIPFWNHMLMGSFFFAMAFMATDPVTASSTNTGKWIYGFSIGFIGLLIRVLNPAYPEGWMLAILFLNVFAPTIDHFVLQRNIKTRLARG